MIRRKRTFCQRLGHRWHRLANGWLVPTGQELVKHPPTHDPASGTLYAGTSAGMYTINATFRIRKWHPGYWLMWLRAFSRVRIRVHIGRR